MKLMQMYKVLEDALVEVLVASDHRSDLLLGQPLLVEEKLGHWLGGHPDEASLLEQLQTLVCVKVELLDRLKEFSFVSDPPSLWGTIFATIDHRTSVLIRFCGREVVRILTEETVQATQVNTVGVRGGGVCAAWNVRVDGVSGPEDWPEMKYLFELRNKILHKNAIWRNALKIVGVYGFHLKLPDEPRFNSEELSLLLKFNRLKEFEFLLSRLPRSQAELKGVYGRILIFLFNPFVINTCWVCFWSSSWG